VTAKQTSTSQIPGDKPDYRRTDLEKKGDFKTRVKDELSKF